MDVAAEHKIGLLALDECAQDGTADVLAASQPVAGGPSRRCVGAEDRHTAVLHGREALRRALRKLRIAELVRRMERLPGRGRDTEEAHVAEVHAAAVESDPE